MMCVMIQGIGTVVFNTHGLLVISPVLIMFEHAMLFFKKQVATPASALLYSSLILSRIILLTSVA